MYNNQDDIENPKFVSQYGEIFTLYKEDKLYTSAFICFRLVRKVGFSASLVFL